MYALEAYSGCSRFRHIAISARNTIRIRDKDGDITDCVAAAGDVIDTGPKPIHMICENCGYRYTIVCKFCQWKQQFCY